MLSICMSVGSSLLSLLAALINLYSERGVVSISKKFYIVFNPPNFSLNVFGAKNSPVHLLVRDCQCLLPLKKSNSILPALEFFLIVNRSKSARPASPVASKYLYNETILSHFSLNRSLDVASIVSGSTNDVSPTLLVYGVL